MNATTAAEISGFVPFFKNPQPLSRERHAALGVKRKDGAHDFAKEAHVSPITLAEFGVVALHYPIVFAREEKTPLAVMGLKRGENLFVNKRGKFDEGAYIPAYLRRYPFVLAKNRSGADWVVCIDEDSDLISRRSDLPFFERGEPTKFTKDAVDFLSEFERQRTVTLGVLDMLKKLDLFEERGVSFRPRDKRGQEGRPVKLADYYAVSAEKLSKLSGPDLVAMRDGGALAAVYAHNLSLQHWRKILERAVATK